MVGAGYVGLTTAACLSHLGHRVVAVDVDAGKVERMRRGESPILEDGLVELITEGLASRRLSFTTDAAEATSCCGLRLSVRPYPPGRGRRRRPSLPQTGRHPDRPASPLGCHRRHQVDGPGRIGGRGGGRPGPTRHDRGLEPRVPAGGERRPRLAPPGPDRDRGRRCHRRQKAGRPLPPARSAGAGDRSVRPRKR